MRPKLPWPNTANPQLTDFVTDLVYGEPMTEFPVEIVLSTRRKKPAQAGLSDGRIRVMVPAGMDPDEEQRIVEQMTDRIVRKHTSAQVDLSTRARSLARRYSLPTPRSIEWSNRQNTRWGSCTPTEGRIRISAKVASMPAWVLDSVIIHELAHLEVADHGPRFREMVSRYELTERARGYLMARAEN